MIGSLSFDGLTYEKGQIFETYDSIADHLLQHSLAGEIESVEPEPTSESEQELAKFVSDSGEEASEKEPGEDQPLLPALEVMDAPDAIDFILGQTDPVILTELMKDEKAGKNRKTVISAIKAQCDSL